MTPYSVIPCHVRLSSPVIPGPVFCCASAGTEAVMAIAKNTASGNWNLASGNRNLASGNRNLRKDCRDGIPYASFIVVYPPKCTRQVERAPQDNGQESTPELLFSHLYMRLKYQGSGNGLGRATTGWNQPSQFNYMRNLTDGDFKFSIIRYTKCISICEK